MDEMRASSPSEEHEEETDAAAILAMKERVAMMHSEAGLLREMTLKAAADDAAAARHDEPDPATIDKEAVDSRSVYVGNVSHLPPLGVPRLTPSPRSTTPPPPKNCSSTLPPRARSTA